jgi:hypothetical protein
MPHQSPDTVEITVQSSGVADIPPLESVGRIHEIGINGEGFMLADNPEQPDSLPAVAVLALDPPRLATSETPFAQAVERYTFESFHDWSGGMGQRWLNREGASVKKYEDSEGLDPFTVPGELSLLPSVSQSLAETFAGLRVVVVGDDMYALVGNDQLKRYVGSTDTWGTALTITDGAPISQIFDLASDGQYWYAATGASIVRGQATDPAAAWSTEDAISVKWAAGRICCVVNTGGTSTSRFTTLTSAGVEEKVGGHLTLEVGHTMVLGDGAAGGAYYFGSYVGDRGQIWAWQLGLDDGGNFHTPFVAWEMPQGLIPTAVTSAAGEVWIRAYRATGASAGEVLIYRGVPGEGSSLTPFLVADLGVANQVGDFAEVGDLILFSWQDTAGNAALGAISLNSGGYCRWFQANQAGLVRSVAQYRGSGVFTVAGHGVYVRDPSTFKTLGWLKTSIVDGASIVDKILDRIVLESQPILASQSIQLEYSLDANATFADAGTLSTVGAQRMVVYPSVRSGTFGLRITLNGPGTTDTRAFVAQMQFHPLGLRDQVVVVRVKAYDIMTGLNGAPLPENKRGRGVEIMRTLLGYAQSRVLFQDVDYQDTGTSEVMEVVSIRADRVGVYDHQIGYKRIGGEVELTMRRFRP